MVSIQIKAYDPKHFLEKKDFFFPGLSLKETEKILKTAMDADHSLYCALINKHLVGHVLFAISSGKILNLYVQPEYRKQGIGRKMIRLIHDRVLTPMLSVQANAKSIGFFKKVGFTCDPNFFCYHITSGRKCC